VRPITDPGQWDELVLRLPRPHLLQSRGWGDVKTRWGWAVHRFAWGQPGSEQAVAQVLVRRAGRLPLALGYLPRGPLLVDLEDPGLWALVLGDLERWARSWRLAVLKMDPDVPAESLSVDQLWRRRGWQPSEEQIQFPNTMVSDLSVGEAALWAALKQKTRYNVGLARRRDVTVQLGGPGDLDVLYDLYAATARRTGFALRTKEYYLDAWSSLLASEQGALLFAVRHGEPLAAVFPVAFGDTAWYLYGASADAGREHMPAYLAQWASLEWALERGCRRYDWWGGPTRLAEDDPLWGVYRFKEGFGATWVPQLGAWDYAPNPALARAYGLLARARHGALGQLRRRT
jgi:lipid II:glycine glycyltransferase (peptidoglycan interpeptide bridge formation enzyme)